VDKGKEIPAESTCPPLFVHMTFFIGLPRSGGRVHLDGGGHVVSMRVEETPWGPCAKGGVGKLQLVAAL